MMDQRRTAFHLQSRQRTECIDITPAVQKALDEAQATNGFCHIYCPHTTAGLTINEGADPAVAADLVSTLSRLVPVDSRYRHLEGNSDAHVKSTLTGVSLMVAVEGGALSLGHWQRVFFCEFDGPRRREIWIRYLGT